MIERHIDYLSFSQSFQESSFWTEKYKPCAAPAFYKRGYEDALGARFFFGNHKSNKAYVVLAGGALELYRDNGRHDPDILAWALGGDGRVGRLDLAVTDFIEDDFVTVDDVRLWYEQKKMTGALVARGAKFISGYTWDFEPRTETFYVGDLEKRGDVGIFRAYDKSLDLGIGNEIITRIELEIRGDKAHNTARRIAETNDISGNFRASFNVDDTEFERLMDAPAAEIVRGQGLKKRNEDEKMDARWQWLLDSVAPSLKEAWEYDNKVGRQDNRMVAFLLAAGVKQGEIMAMLDKLGVSWDTEGVGSSFPEKIRINSKKGLEDAR